MKIKIELTLAQALWLRHILGRGMDGFFEGNPRERNHCDNIEVKVHEELKKKGYFHPGDDRKEKKKYGYK